MYKVLGIDQKEYGPVSAEVLRRWIAEGRANGQTQVWTEQAGAWRPLSALPEFADALAAGPRPFSPPPKPPLVRPAWPQPARPQPQATCGLAVAALVLGLLALPTCGLTALVGLPLAIAALGKIKRSAGRLGGRGLAVAGLCLSGGLLCLLPVLLRNVASELQQARSRAAVVSCVNNLQQLGRAMRMYANDQSDRFALATNWCDALLSYLGAPSAYTCPAGASSQRCHYGYNARLSGLEEGRIHPKTVLFFETDGGWNLSGGPERMLRKPRHGTFCICYADGTVEQMPRWRLSQLRWEP